MPREYALRRRPLARRCARAVLTDAEALAARWQRRRRPSVVAGNALARVRRRAWTPAGAARRPTRRRAPRAARAGAGRLWADGGAVDAAQALPLYVRDKVAQTSAERDALRDGREP